MAEMRPSGVQWIGNIPVDWNTSVLGRYVKQVKNKNTDLLETNLLSLSYGKVKRKDISANDGLLPASFDGYNIIEEGDIVLRLTDLQNDHTSLRVGRATERGIITSAYVTIRPEKNISSEYLYYVLHSFDIVKGFYGMGAGIRQGLTYDGVQSLKIPSPAMPEQQAIAEYLDDRCSKIDEIITEATASIEDYKKLKQAIITQAVSKGLVPNVSTKDSGFPWIGDIPVSWGVTELKFFSTIKSGITLGKQYSREDHLVEVPYLRVANVQDGYVDLSDVATLRVLPQELEKYSLHKGDLLMTEGGDRDKLGRGTRWNGEIEPCLHQNHIFAVSTNKEKLNVRYLEYISSSAVGRNYFDLTAKKTTNLASTNSTTIMNFRIPIPSIEEQAKIVDYLDVKTEIMNSLISEKQSLISDLQAYKKSLIYEVVTGKRRVV